MKEFNIWQTIITFMLSFVPWLFPEISTYIKIIIVLMICLISVLIYCYRLNQRLKTIIDKFKDITQKHNSLSQRFDKKLDLEKTYKDVFCSLEISFQLALLTDERDKLSKLYELYRIQQKNFEHGGENDERKSKNIKNS